MRSAQTQSNPNSKRFFANFFSPVKSCLPIDFKLTKASGKYRKIGLFSACLLIGITYNSCDIRYVKLMNKNPEKPAAATIPDTTYDRPSELPETGKKILYLTFDDGPNKGTSNIMRLLDREKLPATFFVVGSHIFGSELQQSIYKKMLADPDLETANHTFYHARNRYNKYYQSPRLVLEDFEMMHDSARLTHKIGRTPGCDVWRTSEVKFDVGKVSMKAADLLKANGYVLVGWDVEWKAGPKQRLKKSPAQMVAEIEQHFAGQLTKTDGHLVLLLHDQHFTDSSNVKALDSLVVQLKNSGAYEFRKVSEYPCL